MKKSNKRFQLISDLHGQFDKIKIDPEADILLCAGDLSEDPKKIFHFFNKIDIPIVFVAGNHEYYDGNLLERQALFKEYCDKTNGKVSFLDQDTIYFNNLRIIGVTLWSDFDNLNPHLVSSSIIRMRDYLCIEVENLINLLKEDEDIHQEFRFAILLLKRKLQDTLLSSNSLETNFINKNYNSGQWLKEYHNIEFQHKFIQDFILENKTQKQFSLNNDLIKDFYSSRINLNTQKESKNIEEDEHINYDLIPQEKATEFVFLEEAHEVKELEDYDEQDIIIPIEDKKDIISQFNLTKKELNKIKSNASAVYNKEIETTELVDLINDVGVNILLNNNKNETKEIINFKTDNPETFFSVINNKAFHPILSYFLHQRDLKYLEKKLNEPFDGETLIISHHAPSLTALSMSNYALSPFATKIRPFYKRKVMPHKIGGYASSLEKLVKDKNISAWVHGHIHHNLLYRLGNATVHCAPIGNYKDFQNNPEREYFSTYSFYLNDEYKQKALLNNINHTLFIANKLNLFIDMILKNEDLIIKYRLTNILKLEGLYLEISELVKNLLIIPEVYVKTKKILTFETIEELIKKEGIYPKNSENEYSIKQTTYILKQMLNNITNTIKNCNDLKSNL